MKFTPLPIEGAYTIALSPHCDLRGHFFRNYCAATFEQHGISFSPLQANVSHNRARATLRGLHFQVPPHAESKLILCLSGSVFDAFIDLRPTSPTYLQWSTATLHSHTPTLLYLPAGLAQGFQTLEDHTTLLYLMGNTYAPESARVIRYDDPRFAIPWPLPDPILSPKDLAYP